MRAFYKSCPALPINCHLHHSPPQPPPLPPLFPGGSLVTQNPPRTTPSGYLSHSPHIAIPFSARSCAEARKQISRSQSHRHLRGGGNEPVSLYITTETQGGKERSSRPGSQFVDFSPLLFFPPGCRVCVCDTDFSTFNTTSISIQYSTRQPQPHKPQHPPPNNPPRDPPPDDQPARGKIPAPEQDPQGF